MGRGLSELQQTILRRALSNREAERTHASTGGPVDVTAAEVAATYYFDWPEMGGRRYVWPSGTTPAEANRVRAAICRAFRRLEARDLGDWYCWLYGSGFRLNERGVEAARGLSVNILSR